MQPTRDLIQHEPRDANWFVRYAPIVTSLALQLGVVLRGFIWLVLRG